MPRRYDTANADAELADDALQINVEDQWEEVLKFTKLNMFSLLHCTQLYCQLLRVTQLTAITIVWHAHDCSSS
jgi:hypothetical protein